MTRSKLLSPPSRWKLRVRRRLGIVLLHLCLASIASTSHGKPKVHTVYAGQRLGSIAKRYNVTVDELCRENGISRTAPIHPGQKLVIPGTDDGKGSGNHSKDPSPKKVEKPSGKTRIHIVAKGHTLSAIAGRYAVTVSALCYANDIARNSTLNVGQKLIIPHKTDKDGAYARKLHDQGVFDETKESKEDDRRGTTETESSKPSRAWEPYVKPAWRRGYIKMRRYGRYWEGYVIGPKGEVLGHASNKINFVLGAREDGPRIDPKLIRLIASISDKFGGRELRIVSGYRTKSFVAASQHKKGRALDFSIPGIPNEALRDYLRTLDDVGVGYYPNSSFVHLDVRGYNSYWIDYAGPGEAPRKTARRKKSKSKHTSGSDQKVAADEIEEADEDEEEGEVEHESAEDEKAPEETKETAAAGKSKNKPQAPRADDDVASAED